MTEKDYCSKVCKAQCCLSSWALKRGCPKLDRETHLCTIYEERLGFTYLAVGNKPGQIFRSVCSPIKDVLDSMPFKVKQQCCYHNPKLLEQELPEPANV